MTILLTGGGTGGHITPLLAVANELKSLQPDCRIVYVGEKGGKFSEMTDGHHAIDETYTISAGKLRRYYGESLLKRLTDARTNALNVRDSGRVIKGYLQAKSVLARIKPDVVFLKGGFVGVPVGLAAVKLKIPIVTHDSDAVPGLANRLVARWATTHAVALPASEYAYPQAKTRQVGVLVEPNFQEVDQSTQAEFKSKLHVPAEAPILLITGGSSGAVRLNEAVIKIVDKLLADYPELYIIHQVGKDKAGAYGSYSHPRLQVLELMRPMHAYTGAADVVVARASANTLAELGVQRKPVIVVASPFLAAGHQLKNAQKLEEQGAAISIPESAKATDEEKLDHAIRELLDNPNKCEQLASKLHDITITDAAHQMAKLLLETAKKT